jgi:hypothetical protein
LTPFAITALGGKLVAAQESYIELSRGKPLTRRERLRRVVILCASFARNVAYFRSGQSQIGLEARASSYARSAFWVQVTNNFLDIAVLECKLLGDDNDKHFWRNVVDDPTAFEASLLSHLEMTESDFADFTKKMRRYRDKFVAHLDSDAKMDIPRLTAALAANSFYHRHIVTVEAAAGDLFGLADTSEKFAQGYEQCLKEAQQAYGQAAAGGNK